MSTTTDSLASTVCLIAVLSSSQNGFPAPTGRDKPAQGNALGGASKRIQALKGRDNGCDVGCAAPSGLDVRLSVTQGVALGWYGSGRWPERQMRWEGLGV
jgi:hypothetical protein